MKSITLDDARAEPSMAQASKSLEKQPLLSRVGLSIFFLLARRAPGALRIAKPLAVRLALACSSSMRRGTFANARRLLNPPPSRRRCAKFARDVVGNFYDFVVDVGRSTGMTADQLCDRVEVIEGRKAYLAHRARGGGAIILTAHLGSFEVGLAILARVEPHIHVVFKRDEMDGFEAIRRSLRKTLGVIEAPIDDGWETWMGLRDALEMNHVVVMQGDRAMPGQKSTAVPMLGGHIRLPLGPIKLAQISGSPIVPVFTTREPSGACRLYAEPPIRVDPSAIPIDGIDPALYQIGKSIEKFVGAHPEQWLVLSPAFAEDASGYRDISSQAQ